MPLTSAYSPVVLVATEVIVSPPFVGSPDVAPSSLHLHDEWRWQKSTMSRCSTKKPWPQPARARGSERLSTHRQSSFQIWNERRRGSGPEAALEIGSKSARNPLLSLIHISEPTRQA